MAGLCDYKFWCGKTEDGHGEANNPLGEHQTHQDGTSGWKPAAYQTLEHFYFHGHIRITLCSKIKESKYLWPEQSLFIVSIPDTEKENAKSFLAFSMKHVITNTFCKKF